MWEYATSHDQKPEPNVFFYVKSGLLYRHWQPSRQQGGTVLAVEQLVLSSARRLLVLRLAHDVPTAGHLGVTKTQNRVLQRFYWPRVFKDVAEYCTTCEVCQRRRGNTTHRKYNAPLNRPRLWTGMYKDIASNRMNRTCANYSRKYGILFLL